MKVELRGTAVNLPDGIYVGRWSGYTIYIVGHDRELATVDGCRSITGYRVIVHVLAGQAAVWMEG